MKRPHTSEDTTASALERTLARIAPPDLRIAGAMQAKLDTKTKPRRSLGRLEELACQVASIWGLTSPPLPKCAIVVMGADHGVADEGVSAYPQSVTGQMLLNFAAGGAAINVLARQVNARVVVVDMGVKEPLPFRPEIRSHRMGPGTKNFLHGPAMTRKQATSCLEVGIETVDELVAAGIGLIGIGEMGIANTTSASALAALFTGAPAKDVTGRGTGIDDAVLAHKIEVIAKSLELNAPNVHDPLDALTKLGGFEIAGLCGVVLGAAASRVPIVMDGFIASVAALAAVRMCPPVAGYLIASHRSVEAGHKWVLEAIGAKALLDLDLRLGEGTGAALAMSLVESSLRILHEMSTFATAGVSEAKPGVQPSAVGKN